MLEGREVAGWSGGVVNLLHVTIHKQLPNQSRLVIYLTHAPIKFRVVKVVAK